jgi:hypothetical protein
MSVGHSPPISHRGNAEALDSLTRRVDSLLVLLRARDPLSWRFCTHRYAVPTEDAYLLFIYLYLQNSYIHDVYFDTGEERESYTRIVAQ